MYHLYKSVAQLLVDDQPVGTAFVIAKDEQQHQLCLSCFHCVAAGDRDEARKRLTEKKIALKFFLENKKSIIAPAQIVWPSCSEQKEEASNIDVVVLAISGEFKETEALLIADIKGDNDLAKQGWYGLGFANPGSDSDKNFPGVIFEGTFVGDGIQSVQDRQLPVVQLEFSKGGSNKTAGASGFPILLQNSVVAMYYYRREGAILGERSGSPLARPIWYILEHFAATKAEFYNTVARRLSPPNLLALLQVTISSQKTHITMGVKLEKHSIQYRIGEKIQVGFNCTQEAWIYLIFQQGDTLQIFFPSKGMNQNKIQANVNRFFPKDFSSANPMSLTIQEPEGIERFWILASLYPTVLPENKEELVQLLQKIHQNPTVNQAVGYTEYEVK